MVAESEFFERYHLLPIKKEEQDFVVLSDDVFHFLLSIYGGNDLPRVSVGVPTSTDQEDYIVETHLRYFKVVSLPGIKYNEGIKKSSKVYISRGQTVADLHY